MKKIIFILTFTCLTCLCFSQVSIYYDGIGFKHVKNKQFPVVKIKENGITKISSVFVNITKQNIDHSRWIDEEHAMNDWINSYDNFIYDNNTLKLKEKGEVETQIIGTNSIVTKSILYKFKNSSVRLYLFKQDDYLIQIIVAGDKKGVLLGQSKKILDSFYFLPEN